MWREAEPCLSCWQVCLIYPVREKRDERDWRDAGLVCLVYSVCLVCLVYSVPWTKETG
jgi:hypothetical protein